MKELKFWLILIALLFLALSPAGCSCGDDDDDDDDSGSSTEDDDDAVDDDDTADDDDDTTDDDDDTTGHECEELYDVIIEGETEVDEMATTTWTAKLTINDSGTITGVIVPGEENVDQYAVSGFRFSATEGYLDGSFPTPENLDEACEEELIYNHIDMLFDGTSMTGDVVLYCGEPVEGNEIIYGDATGTVTCGDFAA